MAKKTAKEIATEIAEGRRMPFDAFGKRFQGDVFYHDRRWKMRKGLSRLIEWVFKPYYMESHCPICGARYDGYTRKLALPIFWHCLMHVIRGEK